MGKTIKKNQVRKSSVRSVYGGTYVIKGRKFDVLDASTASIASDMVSRGYRAGTVTRWNGSAYRLETDPHFGQHVLVRLEN